MTSAALAWRCTARTILASALVAATMVQAHSQAAPVTAKAATPDMAATTPLQKQAREILMHMARFLSSAQRFSVTVNSNYDSLQKTGQKIEFAERRNIIVNRPNQLHADNERSDGVKTTVVFTGKEMIAIDSTNKIYAATPQQGGVDESIVYFVSDLGMRLPLALLLVSQLPGELEDRVRTIDYVEKTNILGTPSHHLAGRTDTVDFQIWVADGEQPFPLRIVLTYKNAPAQPQFRAQFSNWSLAPEISAATFSAQVPEGAKKVAFAAQLASEAPRKTSTGKRGGK
jgi:hypothetical protein